MSKLGKFAMVMLFNLLIFGTVGVSYAKSNQSLKGKTIFDYKQELKLTNKQISKIKSALIGLNKKVTLLKAKLVIANSDLNKLIKSKGDISSIDKKLREIFDYRRGIIIDDLIASRTIKGTLSKKQLQKWKEIQAKHRGK